jgi:hypothetical protein
MNRIICKDYKDSAICLHLDLPSSVSLVINNVVRQRKTAASASETGFYLSTTLQVGYEEHELIEGSASYRSGVIEARLSANGVELASESMEIR